MYYGIKQLAQAYTDRGCDTTLFTKCPWPKHLRQLIVTPWTSPTHWTRPRPLILHHPEHSMTIELLILDISCFGLEDWILSFIRGKLWELQCTMRLNNTHQSFYGTWWRAAFENVLWVWTTMHKTCDRIRGSKFQILDVVSSKENFL